MSNSWPPAWLTPVDPIAIANGDGEDAIEFAELFGSIGKDGIAGRAGQGLVLRDWQKELLRHLYARDENGGYVAQTALIGQPRKNGKSALSSSAIALYSLLAEGVQGGEVIVAAAEKEQARIVFSEARRMVESSELSELVQVYRDSIYVPSTNSVLKVVSAEAYSKEGANPHRLVLDELHAHRDRKLFDVFSLAMGNRGKIAQLVAITTAGVKQDITGQDSIAYSLYQYGKQVANGELDDPNFFMAWWEAPPEADHRLRETWIAANPAFDDLVAESDFASAVKRTPEAEFRTKRLNQWVNTKNAWLPAGAWDNLTEVFEFSPDDEYIIGFDGSWKNDSTALVAVLLPKEEGQPYRVKHIKSWEKDFTLDDDSWRVDKHEVSTYLLDFYAQYPRMKELVCDPSLWEDELWDWQAAGLPVVAYRNSTERTIPATAKLFDAIMSGALVHDGSPAMARHLDNCILKIDNRGARITKDFRQPKLKVDNAIALMMAYDRASGRMEEQVVPQFFA
jgi:phage terminase large subunit-like protein